MINDGVTRKRRGTGIGLRLAALEAVQHGALVEFGPEDGRRWCVRLIMPGDVPAAAVVPARGDG